MADDPTVVPENQQVVGVVFDQEGGKKAKHLPGSAASEYGINQFT